MKSGKKYYIFIIIMYNSISPVSADVFWKEMINLDVSAWEEISKPVLSQESVSLFPFNDDSFHTSKREVSFDMRFKRTMLYAPLNSQFVDNNTDEAIFDAPLSDSEEKSEPKFLLHQNSMWYFPFNYQFSDGEKIVNDKKLMNVLHTIPQNECLLKQAKGFRIMALVIGIIGIGMVAGHQAYLFSDYPRRDAMMTTFYVGEVLCLAATFATGMTANNKIYQAVENYNLSIMGIPIPTR
jgi:hypothetical protein